MAIAENFNTGFEGITSGSLEVKLAENNIEIDAAQSLRYKVFYEEMDANPSEKLKNIKRDIDPFDHYFDHLLVIDHDLPGNLENKVVGTYRLNRGGNNSNGSGFYTSGEYNIDKLTQLKDNILELGRSCVHSNYRNGKTMQLLWRSIALYVFNYDIKIMFGCASFSGINIADHIKSINYLHDEYLAPQDIRPFALKNKKISYKRINLDKKNYFLIRKKLPPLIKGYLRLGAFIGDGAVIDEQFNTIDVCIVLPTKQIASRYLLRYDRD